jgi:hypothetical protein
VGFFYFICNISYMANITQALNQRSFITPRADFINSSQKELINLIMSRHGEKYISNIKLIDENDDYDSFLVEILDKGYCIKISFDQVPIFYEFMVLKGIEHLQIAPMAIDRNEIDFGNTVYYTIQTFEYSDNLASVGGSLILNENYKNFDNVILNLHKYECPQQVWPHLDDTESYLSYRNINFNNILSHVDENEIPEFNFLKEMHNEVFEEMMNFFILNKNKIIQKKLVHGNMSLSCIVCNDFNFKFINFENALIGSPYFDLCNLVFELQMSGMKEYDFITKKIEQYKLVDNKLKAGIYLQEYKMCKYIWTRKKFLDLLCDYIKEIIILNKTRQDKIGRLSHNFSNHFYRFNDIKTFSKNKNIFIQKFKSLILD